MHKQSTRKEDIVKNKKKYYNKKEKTNKKGSKLWTRKLKQKKEY